MQNEIFSKVKDPRVLGKVKHELEDVLRIALIGVLCSCEDYDEISDLIDDRAEEFKQMGFLRLTNGVPSGDTIRRVVESVNPDQMKASLAISRENILSSLKGCQVIIDGKKLRGENPTSRGCNGLYILNAMVSDYEICVEEERVEDKTNELTVLPSVIASLCIVGALVSVDAMGTHRNIAQQIIMQDGDYLMALKDNQPILKDLVETIFSSTTPLSTYSTEEKGHGRHEKRVCSVMDTKLLLQEGMYEEWPGLRRIVRMERERLCNGVRTKETVYYLSSVDCDEAAYFAGCIRNHWGIENKLHWHLDVTFKEDQCRVRTKNGAVNLSIIRKYALELLKKQTDKLSLKRRRKKCMRNLDYLAMVMNES
ncbi:MAG: ISAs1 family transposase [Muribaculaceae bacterium]|nr:ISAs1 family transposase [Muribaculaceae bacterium]